MRKFQFYQSPQYFYFLFFLFVSPACLTPGISSGGRSHRPATCRSSGRARRLLHADVRWPDFPNDTVSSKSSFTPPNPVPHTDRQREGEQGQAIEV